MGLHGYGMGLYIALQCSQSPDQYRLQYYTPSANSNPTSAFRPSLWNAYTVYKRAGPMKHICQFAAYGTGTLCTGGIYHPGGWVPYILY